MHTRAEFERRVQRIEELVQQIETHADATVRALAGELVQAVMDLHEAGLDHLLETVHSAGDTGRQIIDQLGQEEPARSLLLLYGLHPLSIQSRVQQALEKARPYLQSHKGDVELLGIDETGTVHLRLEGSCDGCPSSALTLKMAIEEAIRESAPDVTRIVVENDLVSLDRNSEPPPEAVAWKDVQTVQSLQPGDALVLDVDQEPILFCRLEDTFYAYGSTCPACRRQLDGRELEGRALTCPGCGGRYDVVQAGRGMDQPRMQLHPFPMLIENGRARVALPVSAAPGAAR